MKPNIYSPAYEERAVADGFNAQRTRLGRALDAESLGCSQWRVNPGEAAYPYHYHWCDEELLIVLYGHPTLRTPEGVRDLAQGEVVRFPKGPTGAHQLLNRSAEPISFLTISPEGQPDIVVYPDSAKIGINERRLGGGGVKIYFRQQDEADYWLDEAHSIDPRTTAGSQSPKPPCTSAK